MKNFDQSSGKELSSNPEKRVRCSDHPEDGFYIQESGNSIHAAEMCCIECDKHLQWVSKKSPLLEREEIRPRVERKPASSQGQMNLFGGQG